MYVLAQIPASSLTCSCCTQVTEILLPPTVTDLSTIDPSFEPPTVRVSPQGIVTVRGGIMVRFENFSDVLSVFVVPPGLRPFNNITMHRAALCSLNSSVVQFILVQLNISTTGNVTVHGFTNLCRIVVMDGIDWVIDDAGLIRSWNVFSWFCTLLFT